MMTMTEQEGSSTMSGNLVASVMSFTERLTTTLSLLPSWMLKTLLSSKRFHKEWCSSPSSSSSLSFLTFPLVTALCTKTDGVDYSYPRTNRFLSTILILIAALVGIPQVNICSAQKLFGKSQPTSIVIPHIKYGQGLNRWSFLSVDRDNRKSILTGLQ